MRGPWAAGAAIVVNLTLGVLPAVAQEASPSPGGSVAVTGAILAMCDVDGGAVATVDRVRQWRGWTVTCRERMSDPRVSGTSEHDSSRDCWYPLAIGDADDTSPIGCVVWSDFVLTGPDGTWEGIDRGFITADGESDTTRVATGTGAYAGWTYVSQADDDQISGFIYEGPPPPWAPFPPAATASPSPPSG